MFCYNCMNEKGDSVICPYCRLDNSMEPAAHHLRPGTVLSGRYVVGYAIGEGGFGITYIGRDTNLDMRVAIKEFYPAGYTNRNSFAGSQVNVAEGRQSDFFRKGKERFLHEARNVAKFSEEPGIVDVRDYFEANGTAYIIMEYLDGMDLNRYLRNYGPMPSRQAFELMLPLMRSLEKIHAAGIIHRDISPDNIMYLRDGSLKLMDFGSARYFSNAETEMSVMLKQGYSPEEQYRKNGQQGPWTDVYGLCATIYRLITGKVPVDGLDRMHKDTLQKPSELGVDISPVLEAVLMYGLAVFSENRCRSMTELISMVQKALNRQPVRIGATMPNDIEAHRAADAGYRTAAAKELAPQSGYGDSYTGGPAGMPEKADPHRKRSAVPIVVIGMILLAVIAGVIIFFAFRNGGAADNEPTEAPTEAATEDMRVAVADVTGMKLNKAMSVLKEQGFDVNVDYVTADKPLNHVVSQSPEADTLLEPGSTVTVYIPEEKPTEAPTEPPTEPPTEKPTEDKVTYVNLCIGGAWFHKTNSRISECYAEGIAFGDEVQYLNLTDGVFMKVRYHDVDGWVLSKYLILKSKVTSAVPVYDREYNEPLTCIEDTVLYLSRDFTNGIAISAGEKAVQVGYCPSNQSDHVGDYYEIYYKDKVYCLPFSILHDKFEYDNN